MKHLVVVTCWPSLPASSQLGLEIDLLALEGEENKFPGTAAGPLLMGELVHTREVGSHWWD